MNCRDLDDLFDSALPPSAWPAEARAHLAACPRCRALEETLVRFTATAVQKTGAPAASQRVFTDLAPVRPLLPSPLKALLLALFTLGVGALLAAAAGNGGWRALHVAQRTLIFTAALAAVAAQSMLVALEMEPGRGRGRLLRFLHWVVPASFFAIAFALFDWQPEANFLGHSARCFSRGLVTALVALIAACVLVRRAYFVSFRRAGAALGLLAGLGGFVSQELYCPVLEPAHIAAAHVGLLVASSLAGFLLGVVVARFRR